MFQWKQGLKAEIAVRVKTGLKVLEEYVCKLKYKLYIFTQKEKTHTIQPDISCMLTSVIFIYQK